MTAHQLLSAMNRRRCLKSLFTLSAGLLAGVGLGKPAKAKPNTKVVVIKTDDRVDGIRQAMGEFDLSDFNGAGVAVKANYNSADPFPASTHPDALSALVSGLQKQGARSFKLIERSGMGDTPRVLKAMGATRVGQELGMAVVDMDDLSKDDYIHCKFDGSHWRKGFLLARDFAEADKVVQTCCLKTHQYGGHFTLALKNAVGAVAKYDPVTGYNYMSELHTSRDQRPMIAEISRYYRNDFILMDAMKAFVDGGPHMGTEVSPGLIIAGTSPVAVDAVGVAVLRMYGTTPEVSRGSIFEQEQIRRGAELGLGPGSASGIDLVCKGKGADTLDRDLRAQLGK